MTSQPARAAAPQTPILLRETVDSIAVLTLNRPAARNSLSEGLIAELHAALDEIHDDRRVRAVGRLRVSTRMLPTFSCSRIGGCGVGARAVWAGISGVSTPRFSFGL